MNSKKYVYISITILIATLIAHFSYLSKNSDFQERIDNEKHATPTFYNFKNFLEVDNAFLQHTENIYFSKNINGTFMPLSYSIKTGCIQAIGNDVEDFRKPVVFENSVSYLRESNNSGKYVFSDSVLFNLTKKRHVEKAISSESGKYLIVRFERDKTVYLIESKTRGITKILQDIDNLISISISEKTKIAVISHGDKLTGINLESYKQIKLSENIRGEKHNLFISEDDVYFSNNYNSEFYQIYKFKYPNPVASVLVKSKFDLRLPKKYGEELYYLEVKNSNYLLKYRNSRTNKEISITEAGTVYDYIKYGERIYFIYSDLYTPRSIRYFDLKTNTTGFVSKQHRIEHVFSCIFQEQSDSLCPAYLLSLKGLKPKAIILYFHPGRKNDDFSPRWDNMLMPLIFSKYLIIAPNFATSTGYGKSHQNKSQHQAVLDMTQWTKHLERRYPNVPIFYYGMSSGSTLMEACLQFDSKNVSGAISAFGIPYSEYNINKIPYLAILGRYDPQVNFSTRSAEVKNTYNGKGDRAIIALDEGHWIKRPSNFKKTFAGVQQFIDLISNDTH